MKKIKVLQSPTPTAKSGGLSQYILNNLKHIDKSKYHFDFLTFSKKRLELPEELYRQNCKVHYISCYPEENESRFIQEINAVFDEGYDAIHLHTSYWKGHLLEEIAVQKNIPVIVVHSHSTMIDIKDDAERLKAYEIHKKIKSEFNIGWATHFCACSKAAADWLFGEQIPRDRIKVLNNAIDVEEFSYNPDIRDKYRKELVLEDFFIIGNIGRFVYPKNHDMLIDIFYNVCKRMPKAKLVLVGIGELEESIREKVNSHGLSDKVLFLGYRTDIAKLLQAMDAFVLPSRFEGLGLVLIEAQAVGLKCLASSFVPLEAKITPNLEFLPHNIDAWADKIIEIADSLYIRKDMSEEITKSGFSIKKQVKILENIYSNKI